ncbi:hypothetical protein SCA6_000520 [Theobroma cacao]
MVAKWLKYLSRLLSTQIFLISSVKYSILNENVQFLYLLRIGRYRTLRPSCHQAEGVKGI